MTVFTEAPEVPTQRGSKEAKPAHFRMMPPPQHFPLRRKELSHKLRETMMAVASSAQEVEGNHRANLRAALPHLSFSHRPRAQLIDPSLRYEGDA